MLELANRLVPRLGGSAKTLRADARRTGPSRTSRPNADVAARVAAARAPTGVPLEEQAVLVRTNARTTEFEEAFHEAGIPFQGASLLDRDAARQLLKVLRGESSTAVAELVRRTAAAQGLLDDPPEKLGDREQTRQSDLARLVRLAEQFDDGERTVADFAESLHERFGATAGRGVHLLTLHRAKGLEFEAVLPAAARGGRAADPARATARRSRRSGACSTSGMTRAKRHLLLTWSGKPSRFLDELGVRARRRRAAPRRRSRSSRRRRRCRR